MHGGEPSDDLSLLRQLRAGNADALRALITRYDRLVRYAIFRQCRSQCQRDGVFLDSRTSETWSGFVESIRRKDRALPQNVKSYLIQIARNKCGDALRRAPDRSVALDPDASLPTPEPSSLEVLIRGEEVLALRSCIEFLSNDEQRICTQIDLILDGSWTRAGEALSMAESTLRTRWAAILGRLRSCVEGKTGKNFAPRPPRGDS